MYLVYLTQPVPIDNIKLLLYIIDALEIPKVVSNEHGRSKMSKEATAVNTEEIQEILKVELPDFHTVVKPALAEGAVHIDVTPRPRKNGPGVIKRDDLERITKIIVNRVERAFGFRGRLQRHSAAETYATFTLGMTPS